jgi:hypothetical protein
MPTRLFFSLKTSCDPRGCMGNSDMVSSAS